MQESGSTCAVCDAAIFGTRSRVGGRYFCPKHYPSIAQRGRVWTSLLSLIAVMVGLGLIMQIVGAPLTPLIGAWPPPLVAVLLSLLPVLAWTLVFRQLDPIEPEPLAWEAGVLALGCLVSAAIIEPMRRDVFQLNRWWDGSAGWALPVYALTEGALVALAVYLVVRFSVFLSPEFDERADGIVYGALAGLAIGVPYNIRYVLDTPGLRLDFGTARIFVASLVLASVGALVGYALGQMKIERHPAPFATGFVVAAALLLGVFEWLALQLGRSSVTYPAWQLFALAAVFALVVFGAVAVLARSAVAEEVEGA